MKSHLHKLAALCLLALILLAGGCGGGEKPDAHSREEAGHAHGNEHAKEHGSNQDDTHADGHSGEERPIKLSREEIKEFGIRVATASSGELTRLISLPGEVKLNEDRLVHVVPRLPGVVRQVRSSLGDRVQAGQVMAVIESWELAEAAAAHVAATVRLELAEATFEREKDLFLQKITSTEDFLQAKQNMIEARIEMEKAEQKHQALDLDDKAHARGDGRHGLPDADYQIIAPISGTVIQKHISLGEVLKEDTEAFLLADLNTVWVDLSVYQKDLPFVRQGQRVIISAGHGIPDTEGEISYVGPVVGEATRTALARVILDNSDGLWKPGLFITARMEAHSRPVDLLVTSEAVQEIHGEPAVFVKTDEGFRVRHVTTGGQDGSRTEITSGLAHDEPYVAQGAFLLKAQLTKGGFGHGHVH